MNYLCIGRDEYLKKRFIDRFRKSVPGEKADFQADFEIFRAGESKITDILDSFNTQPFLSNHKILVVKDVDEFSSGDKDSILKALKSPCKSATMILLSSAAHTNGFLREISELTKVIKCDIPRAGELASWVKKEFNARGKNISITLANLICEFSGNDLLRLENEIEKIVAFMGDRETVDGKDIKTVAGVTSFEKSFELVDFVLDKRLDKVLPFIEGLLTREKPHRILSLLAWQFRTFIRLKSVRKNASMEEIARAAGVNTYFAKRMAERAKRFDRLVLESNLETILEADVNIKSGLLPERVALEHALTDLCRKR
ncbi:MAG: DNA polymerase III subunit delta [Candidatus Omnitrophica bacterium]|nr:DNA polymerase III subunit delta [Candidatus Omnitrophota bacterium]